MNEPTGYSTFRIAPDDVHVAVDLTSERTVGRDVWVLNPRGAPPTRVTFGGSDDWQPFWSPDGRKVAFMTYRNGVSDLFVKTVNGNAPEEPLVTSDGHFIAYESDESGRSEVYVQPFPPTGGKWQVSVGGGNEQSWRGDGRELYYVSAAGILLAVPVTLSSSGFSAAAPVPLFDVGRRGGTGGTSRYEVTRDGKRFLVREIVDPPAQPLMVMLNWPAALKK